MATGVRRPPGRHRGRYVCKWPSVKTGLTMYAESSRERAQLRLLEWDPAVVSYVSQPLRLYYDDDGRARRYTPDVLVETDACTVIIEVKPEEKTLDPKFKRWEAVVRNAFAEQGLEFEVLTERTIRLEPRLSNVSLLLRFQKHAVDPELAFDVKTWVRKQPGMSFGALANRLGGTPDALVNAYALLMHHAVRYDIHQPLDHDLRLFPLFD